MPEFYITATSKPAPFCGDDSDAYVEATTPEGALVIFVNEYEHPCGLSSAKVWASHKHYRDAKWSGKPLAQIVIDWPDCD